MGLASEILDNHYNRFDRVRTEREQIQNLHEATEYVKQHYPLPRCEHGSALLDHSCERLEPPCGCRYQSSTAEKAGG